MTKETFFLKEGPRKQGILWRSKDGCQYEQVHEFDVPGMSETTLRFAADDEMIALVRSKDKPSDTGLIGTSRPPYRQWTWKATPTKMGGPNFIVLPNGSLWATTRPGSGNGLYRMTREGMRLALRLPSGGESSYAGLVWHEKELWMSYYTRLEKKPSIYLARIKIK